MKKRRGPKKGWKKELQRKTNTKVVKDESGQVIDSLNDPIVNSKQDSSISFEMDDREAIYARADAFNSDISPEEILEPTEEEEVTEEPTETITETIEEETEVEEVSEATPEEVEAEVSEEGTAVSEFTEKVDVSKEEVKPEDGVKTVPLAALHESREKGKAKDTKILELERQLANQVSTQQEENVDTYEDPETKALRERIETLESSARDGKVAQDKVDQDNNIKIVHNSLKEQGVDGFDTIGISIVDSTLRKMYVEDAINAHAHDTLEGWAKIYLEALPALQKIGQSQHKADLFEKKKEKKKEANLITSSGKKTEVSEKATKKLTPQEQVMQEIRDSRIT